jgi:YbbR domain-containing protein
MIRFLKDLLTRNWALKLLSFFLAVVLWLTVIPEEKISGERTLSVPLETRNIPSTMELVEKSISTVDITVRATNRLLGQLTAADIEAVLDLKTATVAQEDYALDPSTVVVPPNAKAIRVFPNKVHIKLEKANEVEMEITPSIVGKLKDGYTLQKIETVPANAKLRGPESKFRPKDKLRTSSVDVTGLSATAQFEADLIPPRPDLRILNGPIRVKVRVVIAGPKK